MPTEPPIPTVCYDAKIQLKTNVEPSWNSTAVFLRNDVQMFQEPLLAHEKSAEDCMGLLTDLKKKMQQTKLNARHLVQVEVPVHSLLLNITKTINTGTKMN